MSRAWRWWVAIWSLVEHPSSLALLRFGVGLAVLWDFATMAWLDLVPQLLGDSEAGGFAPLHRRNVQPLWYQLTPTVEGSAWALWALIVLAAAGVTTGTFTRTSAIVLVLLYAQSAQILDASDRGIDRMLRNVLLVLSLSHAGAAYSVDAWRRTGRWRGDDQPVPAWPRHLVVLQLVVMYFTAGIAKASPPWLPMGGYTALWNVVHDPAVCRWPAHVVEPLAPLLTLGTAVSVTWEYVAPLVLVVYALRYPAPPSPLRAWIHRWRPELWFVAVGVIFHLAIAVLLDLGIFPWAMLALYPAFLHPSDWQRVLAWFRSAERA